MVRRISINANGDEVDDKPLFLRLFGKVKPDAICVMNNPRFALDVYYACLNKGGTFFYRTWDIRDTEFHLKVTPRQAFDMLRHEIDAWEAQLGTTLRDKWTFIYRYNEAATSNLGATLLWINEYISLCASDGISVSSMEWAVAKSMNQAEIAAGWWDEHLRLTDKPSIKPFVKHTTHDYISGVSWLDVVDAGLMDFDTLRHEPVPVPYETLLPEGSYEAPLYYMGREIGLYIKRAKEVLGHEVEKWHLIECFLDTMWTIPQFEIAKQTYQRDGYTPMKGIWSHRPYWEALLGQKLSDEGLADFWLKQAIYLDKVMPKNCGAFMNFTATRPTKRDGRDNEWAFPHGTNLWEPSIREYLWERVAAYHDSQDEAIPIPVDEVIPPPTPIELPEDNPMILIDAMLYSTNDFTRIRADTTTNSAELGRILKTGTRGLIEKDWQSKDWPYLEVNGIKGHSMKLYLRIEPIVVVPPAPEEGEYEVDFTIRMTASVRAAFKEIADSLANAKLDE